MTSLSPRVVLTLTFVGSLMALARPGIVAAQQVPTARPGLIHRVQSANERQELTVRQSRILTLDKRIPEFQVINTDILTAQALSTNQIQIVAVATGITQVNLWDEDGDVYTIDVVILGDVAELSDVLTRQFPNASLEVSPMTDGVIVSGIVIQESDVPTIVQIAERYYDNVVPNLQVGGMHQVLLHVKIIEISRTKLRAFGMDWKQTSSGNVTEVTSLSLDPLKGGGIAFSASSGANALVGDLEMMCRKGYAKTLAGPTLVALSGRSASFSVGGEIGYVESVDNNGVAQIGWKRFGTRVDFVPIVLGDNRIHLELSPSISSVDRGNSAGDIPAIKETAVDTSVVLQFGQTLAIAGLIETRIESERRGIPWISEIPYLGTWFGRVEHRDNEVELLIMVTPELASGMNADQVPDCLPGSETTSPNDWQLYMRRHIEVPRCCTDGSCDTCRAKSEGFANASVQVGGPGMIGAFDSQGRAMPIINGHSSTSSARSRQMALPRRSTPHPPSQTQPITRSPATAQATQPLVAWPERTPLPTTTVSPIPQNSPKPQARSSQTSESKTAELPGFMGPVGYDVAR